MALANVIYPADGIAVDYTISFDYLSQDDIEVYVDGVLTSDVGSLYSATFQDETTVRVVAISGGTPVPSGSSVTVQRDTPTDSASVVFADGAVVRATALNKNTNQMLFIAQEVKDQSSSRMATNATGHFDAQNNRIVNLADPVDPTDAVNYRFITTNLPNINTVAGIASDVTAVAAIDTDVTTVAGVVPAVSTLAVIPTDISTVAAVAASVPTVAAIDADVTTVAGNDANVTTVAGISNDVTTVAGIAADVTTVVTDAVDIGVVAGLSTEVQALGPIASDIVNVDANSVDISAVAANAANINLVAAVDTDVTAVAAIDADVTTVAANISNITTNAANIAAVAAIDTDVTSVAAIDADVTTVAGVTANVATVAGVSTDVTTVAGVSTDVTTVAGISADVTAAANASTNIGIVAAQVAAVQSVANDLTETTSEIDTVANSITNVDAVGGDITSVNTVANNLTSVNAFANQYVISATAPTSPVIGMLWFDTTTDTMKVYGGSGFANAGSSVNGVSQSVQYTATAGQTVFSATYDAGFVHVYVNGIKLDASDFTATNGTDITLTVAAAASDIVDIVSFGTFELVNFVISDATDVDTTGGSTGDHLVIDGSGGVTTETPSVTPTFTSVTTDTITLGNWTFSQDASGDLVITTGGADKAKLTTTGDLSVVGNVTAYATL